MFSFSRVSRFSSAVMEVDIKTSTNTVNIRSKQDKINQNIFFAKQWIIKCNNNGHYTWVGILKSGSIWMEPGQFEIMFCKCYTEDMWHGIA